ncbi:hypothetical protein A3Q34_01695 [Colwellia sp. PAMC 20917]|nr:hypothetical protein A3Q34_01695 [Colwellia sp. PAMC 20917]
MVKKTGADYVIDHSKSLIAKIEQLAIGQVKHVASLTHTDSYLDSFVKLLTSMGKIALIDDPKSLDISKLKVKSLSLHWAFMFTRSMFKTTDINEQHSLHNKIANLINQGYIQTTVGKDLGKISATP